MNVNAQSETHAQVDSPNTRSFDICCSRSQILEVSSNDTLNLAFNRLLSAVVLWERPVDEGSIRPSHRQGMRESVRYLRQYICQMRC